MTNDLADGSTEKLHERRLFAFGVAVGSAVRLAVWLLPQSVVSWIRRTL